MTSDDSTSLLLQAHVDGELDAASALSFDRRLETEPDLLAARDRLLALRRLLRENVPQERASDRLRAAVEAIGQGSVTQAVPIAPKRPAKAPPAWYRLSEWRLAAAACLIGAVAGSALTTVLRSSFAPAPVVAEVVADHLRAVMAPQPFDIASSDRHTVKPWFTGRLPFAPRVFDLSDAGFALVGGRVDVLAGQPAASLVFRHGKHLISLTSQPVGTAETAGPKGAETRGFLVRTWVSDGMNYWAVSDIASDELDAFEAAAKAQLAN